MNLQEKRKKLAAFEPYVERLTAFCSESEGIILTLSQIEGYVRDRSLRDGTLDVLDSLSRETWRERLGLLLRVYGWRKIDKWTPRPERRHFVGWQLMVPHSKSIAWLCLAGNTCQGCDQMDSAGLKGWDETTAALEKIRQQGAGQ